jgi:hypothetical protein
MRGNIRREDRLATDEAGMHRKIGREFVELGTKLRGSYSATSKSGRQKLVKS